MSPAPPAAPFAHGWDLTPSEAVALQRELAGSVCRTDDFGEIRRVAGVDIGFEADGSVTRAAVVVLSLPDLVVIDQALSRSPTRFPYIPGLLSFRETPAALAALATLGTPPDLLLVDGQGLAHPRRCGLACHLGLLSGIPSIGVAKTRLIGKYEEPPQARGAWTPLIDHDEVIGAALRSRAGTRPLYVSIGHRVGLESAITWVMRCTGRYRLPETTRHAHRLASVQR